VKTKINAILLFLIFLDLALFGVCLVKPGLWVQLIHGVPFEDSFGMVRRLGAVWAAFFLFQVIALFRWKTEPYWLVLVAGIRWTEIFSDWVYAGFAEHLTWLGKVGLFAAPPVNLLAGGYLLWTYLRMNSRNPQ
jgi:hypothetical protein